MRRSSGATCRQEGRARRDCFLNAAAHVSRVRARREICVFGPFIDAIPDGSSRFPRRPIAQSRMTWALARSRYKITRETRACQTGVSVVSKNFMSARVLTSQAARMHARRHLPRGSPAAENLTDLREVRARVGLLLDGSETGLIDNPALARLPQRVPPKIEAERGFL